MSAFLRSFAATKIDAEHVKRPDSEIHFLTCLFPLRAPSVCGKTGCVLAPAGLFVTRLYAPNAAGGIRSRSTENANIYKCSWKNKRAGPGSALFPGWSPVPAGCLPAFRPGTRQPRDRDVIHGRRKSRHPVQLSPGHLCLEQHPQPRIPGGPSLPACGRGSCRADAVRRIGGRADGPGHLEADAREDHPPFHRLRFQRTGLRRGAAPTCAPI